MPVKVAKRRGRWRIVEPDGRIAKTNKGRARDGGGHSSKAGAQAQAAAINRSLRKRGKI